MEDKIQWMAAWTLAGASAGVMIGLMVLDSHAQQGAALGIGAVVGLVLASLSMNNADLRPDGAGSGMLLKMAATFAGCVCGIAVGAFFRMPPICSSGMQIGGAALGAGLGRRFVQRRIGATRGESIL